MPTFNEKIIYYYKTKDEFPLSIKYAGITYLDKNFYIKRTNSNMFIYEYVTEGLGYIEHNGVTYKVQAGDFFSISTGLDYSYYSDKITPFKKIWFCGDGKLMECLHKTYFSDSPIIIIDKDYREDIENIHNALIRFSNSSNDYLEISTLYINLMTKVYMDKKDNPTKQIIAEYISTNEKAIFIRNYIDDNLTVDLSLEQLCQQLYITKVQLIRLFKREYGITPYAYYLEGKLEIAENLIINTNMQIREIANRVGYNDEYYFSHTFKKNKGYSPTYLRHK